MPINPFLDYPPPQGKLAPGQDGLSGPWANFEGITCHGPPFVLLFAYVRCSATLFWKLAKVGYSELFRHPQNTTSAFLVQIYLGMWFFFVLSDLHSKKSVVESLESTMMSA